MTEIMPVPRNLILLSYQQRAFSVSFFIAAKAVCCADRRLRAGIERERNP